MAIEQEQSALSTREFEQVARAAVRFIEAAAAGGLIRNGAGGAVSAELLDDGLQSGAVEYQLEIRIARRPRLELYAVAGAERIRLLAMQADLGGVIPEALN